MGTLCTPCWAKKRARFLSSLPWFRIGFYLDKWLGTRGIFLTLFILLGIGGGGYTVYRQIRELGDSESEEEKR
ncbi:MAG: AtpZ/AtpI family protein [Deltaproteobacteria bacterium]|nr:AtpZ/AtpI family protein [Deltaproteobacteria bacterium]